MQAGQLDSLAGRRIGRSKNPVKAKLAKFILMLLILFNIFPVVTYDVNVSVLLVLQRQILAKIYRDIYDD